MSEGIAYHDEVTALRDKEKQAKMEESKSAVDRPTRRKRRRAGDTLREKDPW